MVFERWAFRNQEFCWQEAGPVRISAALVLTGRPFSSLCSHLSVNAEGPILPDRTVLGALHEAASSSLSAACCRVTVHATPTSCWLQLHLHELIRLRPLRSAPSEILTRTGLILMDSAASVDALLSLFQIIPKDSEGSLASRTTVWTR